jgi:hypothetical protein
MVWVENLFARDLNGFLTACKNTSRRRTAPGNPNFDIQ